MPGSARQKAGLCAPGRPGAGTLQAERSVLWLAATPPTSVRVQGDCTLGSFHRTGPVHAGGVIKELYFRSGFHKIKAASVKWFDDMKRQNKSKRQKSGELITIQSLV